MRTLLVTLFIFGILLLPTGDSIANAQSLASFAGCSGTDCSMCNIVDLTNGLIQWLIGFLFVLFAIIIAYAGFGLVTSGGNSHAMDEAKGRFTNAIIGLIIVLAAWLVVDTIMRGLVGRPGAEGQIPGSGEVSGWLFWSEVQCYTQATTIAQQYDPEIFEPNLPEDVSIIPPTIPGPGGAPIPNVGSNCSLNESSLVTIPGQGSHRAIPAVAQRFATMRNSLASRGITLTVTSSYRSDARQAELWDQCPICQTEGTVARPCSRGGNGSRHSGGVALDLSSSGSRCDIVAACRAAGASFIMSYSRSSHIHCDWGRTRGESLNISCP
jgi:hypothetical protein